MSNKLKQGKNAVEERLRKFARPVKLEEMNRMTGMEDRGRRTRSSKIFSLGRGLYQAVLYPEPVHFMDKATGEMQEIDNTLYENIVSGNDDITYDRKENHYAVSKELLELGVDDIYSWKGNVFFEHKEKALGMFPQGIVWVKQSDTLPEWMILSTISGQWYYYIQEDPQEEMAAA